MQQTLSNDFSLNCIYWSMVTVTHGAIRNVCKLSIKLCVIFGNLANVGHKIDQHPTCAIGQATHLLGKSYFVPFRIECERPKNMSFTTTLIQHNNIFLFEVHIFCCCCCCMGNCHQAKGKNVTQQVGTNHVQ